MAAAIAALAFAASCSRGDRSPTSPGSTGNPPPGARDFAIASAQFTQGVQDSLSSIPIVRNGNPAIVNVFLTGSPASTTTMRVVLRLFTVGGGLVYSDTVTTRGTIGATVDPGAPTAQFLVPAAQLTAGLSWQIGRDPTGAVPDDSTANDVYPRGAPQSLNVVDVPPLTIRFVPIVLAANGGTTPSLPASIFADYLRTLKSVHPLGVVSTHVGASFSTSASFGTPPNGGDSPFWTALISQLDLARIADPVEPDVNWYGVVLPPPGFTFTSFGGFSYIPTSGSATGPNTRTGSGVGPGWFARPTQARDLVAHEIGHSFGRRHAPCGAAAPPLDPSYPIPGGTLDATGFDVYAWATGLSPSATAVEASTGDVMGYCFPVWASTYTYKAVLAFRQSAVVASRGTRAPSGSARQRVVIVRGSVTSAGTITLEPAFTLDARPTISSPSGVYTVRGESADGRTLFSARVDAAEIDHAPGIRHFTLAVPATSDVENSLDTILVIGPAGRAAMTRARAMPATAADVRASANSRASGGLAVSCGPGARGVVALDPAGSVVAVSSSASASIGTSATGPLSVLCSDGVRTTRVDDVVPIAR